MAADEELVSLPETLQVLGVRHACELALLAAVALSAGKDEIPYPVNAHIW